MEWIGYILFNGNAIQGYIELKRRENPSPSKAFVMHSDSSLVLPWNSIRLWLSGIPLLPERLCSCKLRALLGLWSKCLRHNSEMVRRLCPHRFLYRWYFARVNSVSFLGFALRTLLYSGDLLLPTMCLKFDYGTHFLLTQPSDPDSAYFEAATSTA